MHTGGCGSLNIFHRDIKSANICLTKDFTAKLIDCGLAKFVPAKGLGSPSETAIPLIQSSGGMAFGTPGYMCQRYLQGDFEFVSACDVYSIGVVMAELITGCLQRGQSADGKNLGDFFRRYVFSESFVQVKDGWKVLKADFDPMVEWDLQSLKRACIATLKCLKGDPDQRIPLGDLVHELGQIASMHNNPIPQNPPPSVKSHNKAFDKCTLCNRTAIDTCSCRNNHHMCIECIENNIQSQFGSGMHCNICGHPFNDKDLYGKISPHVYSIYIWQRGMGEQFVRMFSKLDMMSTSMNQVHASVNEIKSGLQRTLGALAVLATEDVKKCPSLIWMIPDEPTCPGRNWVKWANPKKLVKRSYLVYFLCQQTLCAVEPPIKISVSRNWLIHAAPVLKLGLMALKLAVNAYGLPFPLPNVSLVEQLSINESFVTSLLDDAHGNLLAGLEKSISHQALDHTVTAEIRPLTGAAYEIIAEQALKPENTGWKEHISPVVSHAGSVIWVKNEYKHLY